MKTINAVITLIEEMLGTTCNNPAIMEEFIASRSGDAAKAAEELASLPAAELVAKGTTVFPRTEDGKPFIWDYQVKGFLKDAIGLLLAGSPWILHRGRT